MVLPDTAARQTFKELGVFLHRNQLFYRYKK